MKKIRKKLPVIMLVLGVALLLYPSISNLYNEHVQKRVIESCEKAARDPDKLDAMWNQAAEYNRSLKIIDGNMQLSQEQKSRYLDALDATGTGVMGYIEIPKINVRLPIYHGTSDSVLNVAAGHLEWSSLPVGGSRTHCVLSGHRGLASARLFTDIPELAIGDVFVLQVLNRTLKYRVDQILTVSPDDSSELMPVAGKDYCTLLTCTPYGINTHRLLVRSVRDDSIRVEKNTTINGDIVFIIITVLLCIIAIRNTR